MIRAECGKRLYELADLVPPSQQCALLCDAHGRCGNGGKVYAVAVEGNRMARPRRGDWYISGAEPQAYRARNDLSDARLVVKLVRTEPIEVPALRIVS